MSVAQRVARLREAMNAEGLDAFLISGPLNVHYLTGYQCRSWSLCQPCGDLEAMALVTRDRLVFLCDDRHHPGPALANGYAHGRIAAPGGAGAIAKEMDAQLGTAQRLGFEADALLHADALALMKALPSVEWRAADAILARMRLLKDAAEQELLKHAARLTDGAFTHIIGLLEPGQSEAEVASEIEAYLRRHGHGLAFDTIVAFGASAAAPHYHPSSERKLARGDLVLMDFGAVWQGYHGDMTRVVFMGKADDRQKQVYQWVLEAQQACLERIRAGMTEGEADEVCRDYFAKRGVADRFIHGTGHGVGLAIHEPPRLKTKFEAKLEPGMVVTVEPGLYFEGWGGVRIEDVVIVGANGNVNMTHSPKQLMEIPC